MFYCICILFFFDWKKKHTKQKYTHTNKLIFKNAEIFQRFITGVGPTAIGGGGPTNPSSTGTNQQQTTTGSTNNSGNTTSGTANNTTSTTSASGTGGNSNSNNNNNSSNTNNNNQNSIGNCGGNTVTSTSGSDRSSM